jgi:hypothetical protein
MSAIPSPNLSNESLALPAPLIVPLPSVAISPPPFPTPEVHPYSPYSTLAIMATHPTVDHNTLLMLAQGLAKAMLQQEETCQLEAQEYEQTIKNLKQNIWDNTEGFINPPEGYEYNDGIINFDIPVGSGMYQPTKWVKHLDSRQACSIH